MEQIPKLTRKQFLTLVGSAVLAVVVAKVSTIETTLTAVTSPKFTSKPAGYGSSVYGGQR